MGLRILNLLVLGFRWLALGVCSGVILRWRGCVGATNVAPRPSSLTCGRCCSGGGLSFPCHRWFALAQPRWAPMLKLEVSTCVAKTKASVRLTAGLGRRLGIRMIGGRVVSKGTIRKTMVSFIRPPTNLHGYKCPLFIGLNYHITEFITMPLNCYSTFPEYSAASLLFAGQSCHTVFK